ncbi:ABC-2 type transport system ATP-binding protein [Paraoerskovia marina]|uniref:ABC-2 type transport system ATP-binding protein n=1 Tax=Paraoerskovia marina TaxID=545619 RepID=A0A1H1PP75_9CELL|nr:ABC transporter ATP-binding protein [Paraoerskovia marina]SDS12976.1 ABC-2 type transport system ATP-binding protein [Paraoerskovia marina]
MTAKPESAETVAPFAAELRDVVVRYDRDGEPALDRTDLSIPAGTITGLLGRNGAGKSTLLSLLAGFRRPTSGEVLVGEPGSLEAAYENPWASMNVQLVRESGDVWGDERVSESLSHYELLRPAWDADLAGLVLDTLEVDRCTKYEALSRGKKSAVAAAVGLASRAPLTIFDEVYLGMDAPSRYAFYDLLLADYAEHPRTIVLSSHLIEEIERLFEHVAILDHGRTLLSEPAEDLRGRGTSLTGPADVVARHVGDRRVLSEQRLGRTAQVAVLGSFDAAQRAAAVSDGLELDGVTLQDLFVHLTATDVAPAEPNSGAPVAQPQEER